MSRVNLHDRAGIESVYPLDTFLSDAGRNGVGHASVLHGLKILSQPDADGSFELIAAHQQVGERNPEGDAIFLPPFLPGPVGATGSDTDSGREAGGELPPDPGRREAEYASYIDFVLARARAAEFKPPIGPDPRLAGFHGG